MHHAQSPIVLERNYRTTLATIWNLWTTKVGFESWWGPQGFRVEVAELQAQPGGALRYDMIADTPEMIAAMQQMGQPTRHATQSYFREMHAMQHLVITSTIDFLPGVTPYEASITVKFAERDGSVHLTITLDPMHDATFTSMQEQGFTSQLTKLDARFA